LAVSSIRQLEAAMRVFLAACCVSIVIAVIAAAILDSMIQQSATDAFSTSAVRH
jgi:type IV secretory pathway component VirB8